MRPTLLRYVVPLCLSRDRATHPERKRPSEHESAIEDSQHTVSIRRGLFPPCGFVLTTYVAANK